MHQVCVCGSRFSLTHAYSTERLHAAFSRPESYQLRDRHGRDSQRDSEVSNLLEVAQPVVGSTGFRPRKDIFFPHPCDAGAHPALSYALSPEAETSRMPVRSSSLLETSAVKTDAAEKEEASQHTNTVKLKSLLGKTKATLTT